MWTARYRHLIDAGNPAAGCVRERELWMMSREDVRFSATEWVAVLEQMRYRRSIFLEMQYPYDESNLDPLAVRLKKARDAFERGKDRSSAKQTETAGAAGFSRCCGSVERGKFSTDDDDVRAVIAMSLGCVRWPETVTSSSQEAAF
jgi:hypothetical protein